MDYCDTETRTDNSLRSGAECSGMRTEPASISSSPRWTRLYCLRCSARSLGKSPTRTAPCRHRRFRPTEAVRLSHNIRQISIAPLMAEAMRRISEERSVSSLSGDIPAAASILSRNHPDSDRCLWGAGDGER
jgi:hypothetical protein